MLQFVRLLFKHHQIVYILNYSNPDSSVLAILFFYKLCCKYGLSGAVVVRKICSDTHPIFTAFVFIISFIFLLKKFSFSEECFILRLVKIAQVVTEKKLKHRTKGNYKSSLEPFWPKNACMLYKRL